MAKLTELNLGKDPIAGEDNLGNLPEQFGGFTPPPQPGAYRFQLPSAAAMADCWDTVNSTDGQRIVAKFRDGAELLIVQSPGGQKNGETFATSVSNVARARGKKDDPKTIKASDMDYLLQALGETARPKTNQAYAQALLKHAGKAFGADIEWQWSCNPQKPIRARDENNGIIVMDGQNGQNEQLGCGTRFYQNNVDKQQDETGAMTYPLNIACTCGAELRAFAQLARFKA